MNYSQIQNAAAATVITVKVMVTVIEFEFLFAFFCSFKVYVIVNSVLILMKV